MKKTETKKAAESKKTTKAKFDYKGAYEQQQMLIENLRRECECHKREALMWKGKFCESTRDRIEECAYKQTRIDDLEFSVAAAKDAFRAASYWVWFMDSIVPGYKKLFHRKKIRAMEEEIYALTNMLNNLDVE